MDKTKIINLIRDAINFTDDHKNGGYTEEQFDVMHNLLDEIEKDFAPKRSSDDWKGCQGTCDFDPIPNITGWI